MVGAYILREMRTFTSTYSVENENENALWYPMQMLNSFSYRSALLDHTFSLKKGFIVLLLRNLVPENANVNGTRFIVEYMTNKVLFLHIAAVMRKGAKQTLPLLICGLIDHYYRVPGFKPLNFWFSFALRLRLTLHKSNSLKK